MMRNRLLVSILSVLIIVCILATFTGCGHNSFENILGYSGYFKDNKQEDDFKIRTYYGKTSDGKEIVIAESFGYSIDTYVVDIDGDGITELLSNSVYGADSHKELYVFKQSCDNIQIGYVNWEKLNIPDLNYWGCNAVSTAYIPDENCIQIIYCSNEADDGIKTIKTGFDILDYNDWNRIDYPSVEVE